MSSALDVELSENRFDDLLADVGREHVVEVDVLGVLCRQNDGVEPDRLVADILDGDLGLAVRAQVRQRAVLANLGQTTRQAVRERDRQRHELGSLFGGVAEHEALVAGALLVDLVVGGLNTSLMGCVDALSNVG